MAINRWEEAIDLREQVLHLQDWKSNGIIDLAAGDGIHVTIKELADMPPSGPIYLEERDTDVYPYKLFKDYKGVKFFALLTEDHLNLLYKYCPLSRVGLFESIQGLADIIREEGGEEE